MTRLVTTFALLVLAAVPPLGAQESEALLGPSARVRAWTIGTSQPTIGVLTQVDSGAILVMTSEGAVVFHRDSLRRLEVSRGVYSNAWRGLKIGALVGGLAGFGLGYGILSELDEQGSDILFLGAGAGAVAGGVVGLGIGALSHAEYWRDVSLTAPELQPLVMWRDGRAMIGIRMRH